MAFNTRDDTSPNIIVSRVQGDHEPSIGNVRRGPARGPTLVPAEVRCRGLHALGAALLPRHSRNVNSLWDELELPQYDGIACGGRIEREFTNHEPASRDERCWKPLQSWGGRSNVFKRSRNQLAAEGQMEPQLLTAALVSIGVVAGLGLLASRAQSPQGDKLKALSDFSAIADKAARFKAIFQEASTVFTDPRCMNCHPAT